MQPPTEHTGMPAAPPAPPAPPPATNAPAALVPPDSFDIRTRVYIWLAAVFVASLMIADITGSKFFHFDLFTIRLPFVGSYNFVTHSVGMFSFPITFLLTDLVNEYYGRRGARRLTYIGLAMSGLAFTLIYLARKAPVSEISPIQQPAFDAVFGMSNRLYVASLTAYLAGQMSDIWLFGVIKRFTGGRMVWLRATGSTIVSQMIDSFLVTAILFAATTNPKTHTAYTMHEIMETAATGYILKFLIAVGLTPIIYAGRWFIHARFGMAPIPAQSPRA